MEQVLSVLKRGATMTKILTRKELNDELMEMFYRNTAEVFPDLSGEQLDRKVVEIMAMMGGAVVVDSTTNEVLYDPITGKGAWRENE
jgi:hypothetical protein